MMMKRSRGGEERVDMEIWWCWLLRAAVPLNVHISLSLSSHTLFVQIIIASYLSLSPFIVYSLSPPPPLSRVLSLSLFGVCVCLSIYLDGWRARALACIFVYTHTFCAYPQCARLFGPCCCLFQPHARALNYYYYVTIIERAHITHQCTVVVVVLVLLLHNNIHNHPGLKSSDSTRRI